MTEYGNFAHRSPLIRQKLMGDLGAGKHRTRCAAILAAGIAIPVFAVLLAIPVPGHSETYAVDGDDIVIDGQDYRLEGVDAFEEGQTCRDASDAPYDCGAKAKAALAAIIAGQPVMCAPTGKRHKKRLIANCRAGARDVEAAIVGAGWAFVRPDFIPAEVAAQLCSIETEARTRKVGAWTGTFELPYFHKGGRNKTREQVSCPPAPIR